MYDTKTYFAYDDEEPVVDARGLEWDQGLDATVVHVRYGPGVRIRLESWSSSFRLFVHDWSWAARTVSVDVDVSNVLVLPLPDEVDDPFLRMVGEVDGGCLSSIGCEAEET